MRTVTGRDAMPSMSTPEQVAAQAAALARVRAARMERDAANERLKVEILAAIATGASIKDIAVAANLSRQRISQISRGE